MDVAVLHGDVLVDVRPFSQLWMLTRRRGDIAVSDAGRADATGSDLGVLDHQRRRRWSVRRHLTSKPRHTRSASCGSRRQAPTPRCSRCLPVDHRVGRSDRRRARVRATTWSLPAPRYCPRLGSRDGCGERGDLCLDESRSVAVPSPSESRSRGLVWWRRISSPSKGHRGRCPVCADRCDSAHLGAVGQTVVIAVSRGLVWWRRISRPS